MRHEIEEYGAGLSEKPEIVALSKIDTVDAETLKTQLARLKRAAKRTPLALSSATGQNVQEVLRALQKEIDAKRTVNERRAGQGRGVASMSFAESAQALPKLVQFRRIAIKVGSSLLVDPARGAVKRDWLTALANDIAGLHKVGADVLVVSSGAVALGRSVLGLPGGPLKLEDSQAAAAVGQIALARTWSRSSRRARHRAGQILRHLSATPKSGGAISTRARPSTACSICAPCRSSTRTTRSRPPKSAMATTTGSPRASRPWSAPTAGPALRCRGPLRRAAGGEPAARSTSRSSRASRPRSRRWRAAPPPMLSRGGMQTKIEAARIATDGGTHMIIADGRVEHPIARIAQGGRCTWFLAAGTPVTARKKWIAGTLIARGALTVDDGAVQALLSGKSLLPAGVTRVEGEFSRGDCVVIRDAEGHEFGRGLAELRRRRCDENRRAQFSRDREPHRHARPRGADPPGRHGAEGGLKDSWMAGTSPAMTARLGKPSCPAALPSISRVMAGLVPAIHAVVLTQDRHKDRASLDWIKDQAHFSKRAANASCCVRAGSLPDIVVAFEIHEPRKSVLLGEALIKTNPDVRRRGVKGRSSRLYKACRSVCWS